MNEPVGRGVARFNFGKAPIAGRYPKISGGFIKGEEYQLLEKILKAPSIETLLIIGGLGISYAKKHLSSILDIVKKAEEKRQACGYAIYTNYKYLMK